MSMRRLTALLALVVASTFILGPITNAASPGSNSTRQMQPHAESTAEQSRVQLQQLLDVGQNRTARQQKLSPPLRSILSKIHARGITRANARAMDAAALSNPLVRLKVDGRTQIYVHLNTYAEDQLDTLRGLEFEIETDNQLLSIIQGWVPFDRVEAIAALPFVTRVTAPTHRGQGPMVPKKAGYIEADRF